MSTLEEDPRDARLARAAQATQGFAQPAGDVPAAPARWLACLLVATALTVTPSAAGAKSHLWRFTEFFSDATGSVQFIEMFVFDSAGTAETQFSGHVLSSNANDYVFPNNLPPENTFHRWVLIATPAFAALPGAPTPDFTIPPNFFEPAGDEIRYRNTIDIFTILPGAMPTDGIHSLLTDQTTPVNTPTNFAGVEGEVDASPSTVPAVPGGGVYAALFALALVGLGLLRQRRGEMTSSA
jgi:MYXO-CTERM domain-containing protein